jgi:YtkA-like
MIDSLDERQVAGRVMRKRRGGRRWIAIGMALLVLLAGGFGMMRMHMNYVPPDLDLATTRSSHGGIYWVRYETAAAAIPVNQIHSWTIHIETTDGRPVEGATITVDGDMPQHLHGLPTAPQVTQELGGGAYLVEGLKFHMPGWWVVDYTISTNAQTDTVRFNLLLP